MKILILNGPNLNLLGKRDPEQYGTDSLDQIDATIRETYPEIEFTFVQSNHEGKLIDAIQHTRNNNTDAIVANWGGFTHTSVAIRDALELVPIPKVEVHLSNIHSREEFREKSVTGSVMDGVITGFGTDSYQLGIEAALSLIMKRTPRE